MSESERLPHSRREFMRTATLSAGAAMLLGAGLDPTMAAEAAKAVDRSSKPLKAAFSNAGLQATWCAQGKQAAEYWGKLYNVNVTWFDGQLSAPKQRAAIDDMASQKWDFVAIQAFGIGTLTAPVQKMIDAGIPVIDMDTLIAPLDQINVHAFLAPDNEFMGASVTQALVSAIGGKGNIIMTQGALGHTGAQGRARGFEQVVKQYPNVKVLETQPADWDVSKTARLWETYLTKYPQIDAAFFHNDDMALAAVSLDDKYTLERGRVYLTGIQALVRLPMMQRQRDSAVGLSYTFGGGQHPDVVGNPVLSSGKSIYQWFNTAAFAQPANFTSGDLSRTYTGVRADWTRNLDASLFKNFQIKEKIQLQFRAESFNLTNTPIMNSPGTTINGANFGVITGQSNPPRNLQLALKLLF